MISTLIIAALALATMYSAHRARLALAFEMAWYVTSPAPTSRAMLTWYAGRIEWRAARCMLHSADKLTARLAAHSERA